nr:hypothetical protein [Tanacetum cinerariifolium]
MQAVVLGVMLHAQGLTEMENLTQQVSMDKEQMAFLGDNRDIITISQVSQEILTLAAFQTNNLDAFDSDCDEAPSTSVVLMAKLSSYDSDVLSDVPTHENYLENHVTDQNAQETQYSKQPVFNTDTYIDITSDSIMISYEQYLKETKNTVVQNTSSSAQQDAMIMSVIEEMTNQVAKCNEVDKENKIINESLTAEPERYKE